MKDDRFLREPISSALDIPLSQQLYAHLQTAVLTGDLNPGQHVNPEVIDSTDANNPHLTNITEQGSHF